MKASRGMGAIAPSKMPRATKKARRDDTAFTQFKEGGWIEKARKDMGAPGALHAELGIPKGQKIPASKLAAAAKKPGIEGKRARLAITFSKFK